MIMNKEVQRQRIGQRIKEIRTAAGVSQSIMAERLGTHQANVARMESGKYNIGYDTLQAIADLFGKEIDFIERPTT